MRVDPGAAGWLGLGVAFGFLIDWIAVLLEWKVIKPFTKPLAMLMVILWTAFCPRQGFSPGLGMLLAAQAFGLVGDILLLFPEKAFFLGLGSFLLGHVFYLGLLISSLPSIFLENSSVLPPWGWLLMGLLFQLL